MNQLLIGCYLVFGICAIFLYRKFGLMKVLLFAFCGPLFLFVMGVMILLIFGDR